MWLVYYYNNNIIWQWHIPNTPNFHGEKRQEPRVPCHRCRCDYITCYYYNTHITYLNHVMYTPTKRVRYTCKSSCSPYLLRTVVAPASTLPRPLKSVTTSTTTTTITATMMTTWAHYYTLFFRPRGLYFGIDSSRGRVNVNSLIN